MSLKYLIEVNRKSLIAILFLLLSGCGGVGPGQQAVINLAKAELGVKYKYGGSNPELGFDCSGLVYYVYSRAGYAVKRTNVHNLYNSAGKVFFMQPGDLLFFTTEAHWWSIPSWFRVSHVGIYIGDSKMLHAPESGGKVHIVEGIFKNKYWMKHYRGAKRLT